MKCWIVDGSQPLWMRMRSWAWKIAEERLIQCGIGRSLEAFYTSPIPNRTLSMLLVSSQGSCNHPPYIILVLWKESYTMLQELWVMDLCIQTLKNWNFVDSLTVIEGSTDDRRSMSRWCFSLGSAAIAWSFKKQLITSLSSTEAEYILATSAACEVVWLRR